MSNNPIREGEWPPGHALEVPVGTKITRFGKFFIAAHPDHPPRLLDPVLGRWQEVELDTAGEPIMVTPRSHIISKP